MKQSKEEQVTALLQENVARRSAKIAARAELSLEELRQLYGRLKGRLPPIPQKAFGVSDFFRRIMERDVLSDPEHLRRFRESQFAFPDCLELHLGPSCQCACRFCWRWSGGQWVPGDRGQYRKELRTLPPSVMPEDRAESGLLKSEDIQSLFSEFKANGGRELYFSGGLEFFTSQIAQEAIRMAAETGIQAIHVYTNGVAPCFDKPQFVELLVRSAESVRFSLHAATADTYAYVQMPHRSTEEAAREFANVRRRVENIVRARNRARGKSRVAKIGVAFLIVGRNLGELESAIAWMHSVGVDDCDIRVDMREEEGWFTEQGEEDLRRIVGKIQRTSKRDGYHPMSVNARIDASMDIRRKLKEQHVGMCRIPLKKPSVDPWGHVYSCCYRAHPSLQKDEFLLGKYPERSLSEIFEGAHDSQPPKCPRAHCSECTDWEMVYNACMEKVLADWGDGIPPEEQPFVPDA